MAAEEKIEGYLLRVRTDCVNRNRQTLKADVQRHIKRIAEQHAEHARRQTGSS